MELWLLYKLLLLNLLMKGPRDLGHRLLMKLWGLYQEMLLLLLLTDKNA
jgi:hypothetical protein